MWSGIGVFPVGFFALFVLVLSNKHFKSTVITIIKPDFQTEFLIHLTKQIKS